VSEDVVRRRERTHVVHIVRVDAEKDLFRKNVNTPSTARAKARRSAP
jgi:hypothetical protein